MFILSMSLISKAFGPDSIFGRDKRTTCIRGCQMAVEMIIDHWSPSKRRYRTETFCYGPRACPLYRSGPKRKVPGRHGMSYTEEDWVDDEATSRRGPDE
jgi:hypothetical protein